MGNVNMPTPVALAGGALCLLAGYLVGAVAGQEPNRSTAEVETFDNGSQRLCLGGEGVDGQPGADDGQLCGVWRRSPGSQTPKEGDAFRFVSIVSTSGSNSVTYIYGDVAAK